MRRMITDEQEEYVLNRAYIPEHVVGLMTRVSGAEPFLMEGYFYCRKRDWAIVVGYPLQRDFRVGVPLITGIGEMLQAGGYRIWGQGSSLDH
jgi:hypothetical protein